MNLNLFLLSCMNGWFDLQCLWLIFHIFWNSIWVMMLWEEPKIQWHGYFSVLILHIMTARHEVNFTHFMLIMYCAVDAERKLRLPCLVFLPWNITLYEIKGYSFPIETLVFGHDPWIIISIPVTYVLMMDKN